MGKRKVAIELIEDKINRNITFCKRKRGILKKAMELSKLCDQKICLVLYDEQKKRMTQYQSHNDFTLQTVLDICGDELSSLMTIESYTNTDYELLESNMSIEDKD